MLLLGNGELFEEIKRKEEEAKRQWIQRYGEDIARLAFQYGVPTNHANEIATKTFQQLFKELSDIESENELWQRMYEIAIQKFNQYEQTTINEFTFEEDAQLHKEIIQLSHMTKLAFILSTFTRIDSSKIASILSLTSEEVTRKSEEARMQLSNQQLEKRLELLQKSYHRVNFYIDEAQALKTEETHQEVFEQTSVKSSKRTVYMLVFGVVALIGITLFSVFNSEAYQQAATEKWIEKMKDTYEQQRTQAFVELGLEDEDERMTSFSGLFGNQYLTQEEKMYFQRFIKEVESDFEENNPIDKEKVNEEFDEIIDHMISPSEMIEDLFKNPLTDDKEASQDFLEKYLPKRYVLSAVYSEKIYESFAMDNFGDEVTSIEEIVENPDFMTDDIEKVINKMKQQQLYIQFEDEEYIKEQDAFLQNLQASLHPDLGGYVTMLRLSSYSYYWFTANENHASTTEISEMESTLLSKTSIDVDIEQLLASQYAYEVLNFIRETDEQVYDKEGFVHQETQEKWIAFIAEKNHPIATTIVERIIEEFKETNWRYSYTFIYLEPHRVWDIIHGYKEDYAEPFNWDVIKNADHQSIGLPNRGYENRVDEIYEQLEQKKDIELLNGVDPLTTIGVLLKAYDNEARDILKFIYGTNIEQDKIEEDMTFFNTHEMKEDDYLFASRYSREVGMNIGETDVRFALMPEGDRWTIRSVEYQSWE